MTTSPPIAITMGEPAGIGTEITAMAWHRRDDENLAPFYLVGDGDHAERLAGAGKIARIATPAEALSCYRDYLPVLHQPLPAPVQMGKPDSAYGRAVMTAIETAVRQCRDGEASGIVTNPIQKASLYAAGFDYPGHTEYLAALCAVERPVMMLVCPELRTVPVTIHVSIADVLRKLTTDLIVNTCRVIDHDLRQRFAFPAPRLAVTGLNPHGGEAGEIGSEETEIIIPAIEALRRDGLSVSGPHAADSLFHDSARQTYDVAVCMFHDQALIPIKTIGFDRGVNVTLGLPIIRTSPDHGTALNLAGSGKARPDSMIAAIKLAQEMARKTGVPDSDVD